MGNAEQNDGQDGVDRQLLWKVVDHHGDVNDETRRKVFELIDVPGGPWGKAYLEMIEQRGKEARKSFPRLHDPSSDGVDLPLK